MFTGMGLTYIINFCVASDGMGQSVGRTREFPLRLRIRRHVPCIWENSQGVVYSRSRCMRSRLGSPALRAPADAVIVDLVFLWT